MNNIALIRKTAIAAAITAGMIGVPALAATFKVGERLGVEETEIRAALEAQGYVVHEIEFEDGEIEAEVTLDGQEYEIEMAADGTITEIEAEDDDDDDDDGDDDNGGDKPESTVEQ